MFDLLEIIIKTLLIEAINFINTYFGGCKFATKVLNFMLKFCLPAGASQVI